MTYTLEQHATIPAIISTWHEDFEFARDAAIFSAEMRDLLNAQESPVFYIMDISIWKNMAFNDLIEATSMAARGKDANFHNPMNMGTLIITNEPIVKISANGLKSDAFGNANVLVFGSLDDALAYASQKAT